jgi:ATPase family AAA domain-containing protein 3A/B
MHHLLKQPAAWTAAGLLTASFGIPIGVAYAEKKEEKESRDPYFNPDALERGAKALREINTSPYAKQASQQRICHLHMHVRVDAARFTQAAVQHM